MSLRLKFILALLVTSLAVIALSGCVARSLLLQRFGEIEMQGAFADFRTGVTAYIGQYGSWEVAQRAEPFREFIHRLHSGGASPAPGRDSEEDDGSPDGPPPGEEMQPGGPSGERSGAPPPPPAGPREEEPPFRFLLFDPQGRILLGGGTYAEGQTVPAALRRAAAPIMLRGKLAAWAVPVATPNLSRHDRTYLATINEALAYAAGVACILALILGWILGDRMSARLRRLTAAFRAVGEGRLLQRVEVNSRDELGSLAAAFNRMSAELARTHEELQRTTEEVRAQAALLKEQSIRDPLTHLYNRRHFAEQAETLYAQSLRYQHPLSVMVGDLDEFKRINDRFSHGVGDEVLRRVARILEEGTRASDVVARYGGEEFVIAFCETPLETAAELCERLREQIEMHPWSSLHPDLQVTISIGLSDERDLGSVEAMLATADQRLYHAKATGKNRTCW